MSYYGQLGKLIVPKRNTSNWTSLKKWEYQLSEENNWAAVEGGLVTDIRGWRIHKLLSSAPVLVTKSGIIELFLVGGGGSGGGNAGGGGGGGEVKHIKHFPVVAGDIIAATVGLGGATSSSSNNGYNGTLSLVTVGGRTIVAKPGGYGGGHGQNGGGGNDVANGGGGGSGYVSPAGTGGVGVNFSGGNGAKQTGDLPSASGGGGASANGNGSAATLSPKRGGNGAAGMESSFDGTSRIYGSGGGGGSYSTPGLGGTNAGNGGSNMNAVENTGSGGGGGPNNDGSATGTGAKGIIMIRYKQHVTNGVPDPNTIMLCSFDSILSDRMLKQTVSFQGGAAITASTKKYGTGSLQLAASGQHVRVNNSADFVLNDFTIEAWIYVTTAGADSRYNAVFNGNTDFWMGFGRWPTGKMNYFASSNGSSWDLLIGDGGSFNGRGTITVPTGQWVHVVFSRQANTWLGFVNGQLDISPTVSGTLVTRSEVKKIGKWGFDNAAYEFVGFIDDMRISKVARYTEAFTPQNSALSGYIYP
jgi:mucin-19